MSVLVVVLFGSRIREAVAVRRARRVAVRVGPTGRDGSSVGPEPESKGRRRLRRFLVRYGVTGASLLGPVALPTQFTAAALVASGVRRERVLLWQAIAILLWTALATAGAVGVLALTIR